VAAPAFAAGSAGGQETGGEDVQAGAGIWVARFVRVQRAGVRSEDRRSGGFVAGQTRRVRLGQRTRREGQFGHHLER
jgi:hypothetical protein